MTVVALLRYNTHSKNSLKAISQHVRVYSLLRFTVGSIILCAGELGAKVRKSKVVYNVRLTQNTSNKRECP